MHRAELNLYRALTGIPITSSKEKENSKWGTMNQPKSPRATLFIHRGVPYDFEGQMTYLVMNGPAFVPGSDQVLE